MSDWSWTKLREQVHGTMQAKYAVNTRDKWFALRECWNRYPREQRLVVLRFAQIEGEPRPLESYSDAEKRSIALAVRDMRFFSQVDRALNGDILRRLNEL